MTLPVREQVLAALKQLFEAQTAGQPSGRPYPFAWSTVSRAPLTDEAWTKAYSLGVHDTAEDEEERTDVIYAILSVVLEFRARLSAGDVPSEVGNAVIANIKRRLGEDRTLGGLCIDCVTRRNELYVEDEHDKKLSGALFLRIIYRYRRGDPWQRV